MAKRIKRGRGESKSDDKTLYAFLATFFSVIGLLIAILAKKNDKYVIYYAKQGLVIFVAALIAGIVGWIFIWIPIFGWVIRTVLDVLVFVLWLISWIYALSGKEKSVPLVGKYAEKINISW